MIIPGRLLLVFMVLISCEVGAFAATTNGGPKPDPKKTVNEDNPYAGLSFHIEITTDTKKVRPDKLEFTKTEMRTSAGALPYTVQKLDDQYMFTATVTTSAKTITYTGMASKAGLQKGELDKGSIQIVVKKTGEQSFWSYVPKKPGAK